MNMDMSSETIGDSKGDTERDLFELYMAALEGLPEGLIVADGRNEIVFVNKAAENIRRISADQILKRNVVLCHSEKSHDKVKRALQFLRRPKSPTFKRMVRDTVNNKHYENTYGAIRDKNNNYLGALIMSRDVTERRKLEEKHVVHVQELKEQVERLTAQSQDLFISSMTSLVNALEAKDPYTAGHSIRVSDLAGKIVEHRYGVSPEVKEVQLAGKFHDIGKVGIHERILHKPEKLTEEEFDHIKEHPVISEKILAPFEKLKSISNVIRHHHERFDGKGYPDGLAGEDIPELSRILAIVDSYDAMTSARPYRAAMKADNVIQEIKKSLGTQFDPALGEIFIELFDTGSIG